LPPELLILAQICTKSFVGWGFAPDLNWGSLQRSPDPLAGLAGGTPGEREGEREGERREGGQGREERRMEGWDSRNAQIQSWQAQMQRT